MPNIGIIGGSGIYDMPGLRGIEEKRVSTPYGEPSANYRIGELSGAEVVFIPRHGSPHRIPPDKVNYRANIWGFKELGVERVISVSATGGINPDFKPGEIILLDQVIDMVSGMRPSTFYETEVVHVDFTEPYCPELRKSVLDAAERIGVKLRDGGTYICVNGPRLESRAEIKYFSQIGADVVGMTGMPEAALASELEICFCALTVVTNYAAGLSGKKLSAMEVVKKMGESTEKIKRLLAETLPLIPSERGCPCKEALGDAKVI